MNKLFYTELTMGSYKEYAVTLVGDCTQYRTFVSAAEAKRFMKDMENSDLLEKFMYYGKKRVPLSAVVKQETLIMHRIDCPNGSVSLWYASLRGDHLEHHSGVVCGKDYLCIPYSNAYTSLNAFIRSHYSVVRPNRKGGNGWIECKALVNGKWTKMSELRDAV